MKEGEKGTIGLVSVDLKAVKHLMLNCPAPGWSSCLYSLRRKLRSSPKTALVALILLLLTGSAAGCSFPALPDQAPMVQSDLEDPPASPPPVSTSTDIEARPQIRDIEFNRQNRPERVIPRFEKLEIDFQVKTSAENLQMPYDPAPPPGLKPGTGISVDAYFTPDDWQTVYRQPAFFYQDFDDQIRENREWFYPTGQYSWKVRFSPHQTGNWQVRLVAQDASGFSETAPISFTVIPSDQKGFIRVAENDPRYFETQDGYYFPALGYNLNFDQVSWNNPVLDNAANFQKMQANGIQLARIWLSQWGIFGASWNPWNAIDPVLHSRSIPYSGLTFDPAYPGSEVSMRLDSEISPCMVLGFMKASPAVLPETRYRVRIRYRTEGVLGPRDGNSPYGLVAKLGGWLWGEGVSCEESGSGETVTPYQPQDTTGWEILEGSLVTGRSYFLPNFYLALENVVQGKAWIDYVWIEQDLGGGNYGPNIVPKPWMAHHLYFEQRNSYAFDKVLELAEAHDIYFRIVVMEKNDWILNRIDDSGQPIHYDLVCDDLSQDEYDRRCPANRWFYGDGRNMTKVRWLQQAWWRYLQARWGYSQQIHSWELLNEGDPASEAHFILADEFGKFMHQFEPNAHLISTSTWNSFPRDAFWANPEYPDVDFADIHMYLDERSPGFLDPSAATADLSLQIGARQPAGAGKPVIRGELGFTRSGSEPFSELLLDDTQGIWLHNLLWAGLNSGGLIESYWYVQPHIYNKLPDGETIYDHRSHFRPFANFLQDLPLNNGYYQDAEALSSTPDLRVFGQKDLVNQRAHVWIQNRAHLWKGEVDGKPIPVAAGIIRIAGFHSGQPYRIEWWNTYELDPNRQIVRIENTTAGPNGEIQIVVEDLQRDLAVKISPQ